jgi:hypothetical protein
MSHKNSDRIQEALAQLSNAPVFTAETEGRPTILGGNFQVKEDFAEFLRFWQEQPAMPYRIWEHVSSIEFADEPAEPAYLERGDVFGEGGHLSLRRNVDQWLWHYIGEHVEPPETFTYEDFWTSAQGKQAKLRRYEETALLWGEDRHGQGLWQEDRVAVARLNYPVVDAGGRVQLVYWHFMEAGQTAFVWYRALETYPGNTQQQVREEEHEHGTE